MPQIEFKGCGGGIKKGYEGWDILPQLAGVGRYPTPAFLGIIVWLG